MCEGSVKAMDQGKSEAPPTVSIGMPVYNGERFVRQAMDSLLAQTFTDFELIISDNASTDATTSICQGYAIGDRRIRYIRQPENRGAVFNFGFVLQEARSQYFMWAAADDFWYPEFIEANYRVLSQDPHLVSSISKARLAILNGRSPKLAGTYPISGEYLARLRQYLSVPGANSRFYGLFKREQLLRAYNGVYMFSDSLYGFDWAVIINLLKYGSFYEVDKVMMEKRFYGDSSEELQSEKLMIDEIRKLNLKWPNTFFPLFDFTRWLWLNTSRLDFLRCIDLIIMLHVRHELRLLAEITSIRKRIG